MTKSAGCFLGPEGRGLKRTSALFRSLTRVSRIPSECPKRHSIPTNDPRRKATARSFCQSRTKDASLSSDDSMES